MIEFKPGRRPAAEKRKDLSEPIMSNNNNSQQTSSLLAKLKLPVEPIFPIIEHIDEIRQAIHDLGEFSETKRDDYVVFNYQFGHVNTFPSPSKAPDPQTKLDWLLRRECRGLIFHAETGKLLSRRYHKFFNVNELDETDSDEIDKIIQNPHVLAEKLDGSFIAPFISFGKIRFGGKTGVDKKHCKAAEALIESKSKQDNAPLYFEFAQYCLDSGFTPIFELCLKERKIVVEYKESSLILTSIRHMRTGCYIVYEDMKEEAENFKIPVASATRDDSKTTTELFAKIKPRTDIEGVALTFDDGRIFKVKSLWFASQVGNSDLLCQKEREVWSLILNQDIDDVKSMGIQQALRHRIEKFSMELYANLQVTANLLQVVANEILTEAQSRTEEDHKPFVQAKIKERAKNLAEETLLHQLTSSPDKDPMQVVIKFVASSCKNKSGLESVRQLANGITFY